MMDFDFFPASDLLPKNYRKTHHQIGRNNSDLRGAADDLVEPLAAGLMDDGHRIGALGLAVSLMS